MSTAEAPSFVVTLQSRFDVESTAARIRETLTSHGMTIFADIDQAAAAVAAGTTLRATRLILFGNPKGGTPVMAANPHAALELPLKAVIWEDEPGSVCVDYLDPTSVLTERYGVDAALTGGFQQVGKLLARALE